MSIFKQKRKNPRRALIYYLEVFESGSDRTFGRTIDITIDGFQLISETLLTVGKVYELRMILPEEIQEASEIIFNSRCIRSYKDPYTPYYYSGFHFKDMDPAQASIIGLLISDFGF